MVWKRGKRGLNSGATMKFGLTDHLMRKMGSKTEYSIRKILITGRGIGRDRLNNSPVDQQKVLDKLSLLSDLEERETIETQLLHYAILACHRNPQASSEVDMSLNKRKRWEFVDHLRDYLQSYGWTDTDMVCSKGCSGTCTRECTCNSDVCVFLMERLGDFMFGSKAFGSRACKGDCLAYHVRMGENLSHSALPNKKLSFYWDLRDKSRRALLSPPEDETPRRNETPSLYHNQRFRGIQRKHVVQIQKNMHKKKKRTRTTENERNNRLRDPRFQDGRPEVMYVVTYPRPLDASTGFQRLHVCKWDWAFRTNKSKSKCKGQKIARRADYYRLSQKDLTNYTDEIDVDLLLYLTGQEDIDDIGYAMLGGHLSEEKVCQSEEKSRCLAEIDKNCDSDVTCVRDEHMAACSEPKTPWGTGFELSMVNVDDELLTEEFEVLESPRLAEFEVVEKPTEEREDVTAWFSEKEDSGFVHVDSENCNDSARKTVTLGDFIKHKHCRHNLTRKKKKR